MLKRLIAHYNIEKAKYPSEASEINARIAKLESKLTTLQSATPKPDSRWWGWAKKQGARNVDEDVSNVAEKATVAISEKSTQAQDAFKQQAAKVKEAYDQSVLSTKLEDTKLYRRTKWKVKEAAESLKSRGRSIDEWSKVYTPTFRKGAVGGAKLAAKAASATWNGAKQVGGAAVQGGVAVTGSLIKATTTIAFLGFWLVLTLGLYLVDYIYFHFGGIDYKILLDALSSGGISLLIRIMVPLYSLLLLIILLALVSVNAKKIGFFLLVVFIPLIIVNYYDSKYIFTEIPYIGLSLTLTTLIASMVIVVFSLEPEDRGKFLSWALLTFTVSTILSLNGLFSGWHHLLIAFLMWAFVIEKPDGTYKSPNYITSVLLIIDFFGFGILKAFAPDSLIANRFIFPVWFLFLVFYSGGRDKSKFSKILMVLTMLFYIFALVEGAYGWANVRANANVDPQELDQAKTFFEKALDAIKNAPAKIKQEMDRSLEAATGGYYNGKVEENTDPNSQLGVYIENLQAADKQFYENEQVTVWGDLKARTLDEPINIYMSCSSGKEKGKIVPDYLAKPEYLTDPKQGYEIAQLEETGFECRFNPGQLAPGSNSVSIKVEFNFNTLAFLKTYFMDIERMRAMRKDNIDPLAQYGITDKAKSSISTYGPIKLGMGTTDPPIGLSQENEVYTFVGITVQNQWPNGRIKNITKLIINTPINLELEPSEDSGSFCRGGFELNLESAGGYTSYKMKDTELQQIKTPITAADFRSFRCPIKIEQGKTSGILGNIPVATYYYRSEASYIYEIEKTLSVFIKNIANETTKLKDCTTECKDTDGCICNSDESCTVAKGIKITKGTSCNTYIAPAQTPSPTTTPPTS
ncbi:MAG: hypothetical protein KJ561_00875 [Nanoarchaeota archaeon]|nr:hypothetical protein [Nanoarchaeota archaeon]